MREAGNPLQKFRSLKAFTNEVRGVLKYYLLFPQKYSAACINSRFGREESNRSMYQQNAADRGHQYFGRAERVEQAFGDASLSYRLNPQMDFYLRRIIALCKAKGIALCIEQLPVNEATWEKWNENGKYETFRAFFRRLSEETGVPVESEHPSYPPECFGDASHVNWRGAERFTAEIKAKYGW